MSEEKIMTAVIKDAAAMNCICMEISRKLDLATFAADKAEKSERSVSEKN